MSASITVRDVMTREFVGVSEGDEVVSTARLLLEEGAECAVAMRGREPVGLLTERDLLAWFVGGERGGPASDDSARNTNAGSDPDTSDDPAMVGDAMSTPVRTVPADDTLEEASREMSRRGVRWLVAIDDEPSGVPIAR